MVMTLGVEDSGGESQGYMELDGVNEQVDMLKKMTYTLNIIEDADGIADMAADDCKGQYYINNTQSNTYVLPPADTGLNCCFYADSAHKVIVDVDDGVDEIKYEGVSIGAGDELDSSAAVGDWACFYGVDDTYWIVWDHRGTWVDD
jgi:hypothetical protein